MFNVLIVLNRTAVNICKFLLFATIVKRKMCLFVYGDVSNKWNCAV